MSATSAPHPTQENQSPPLGGHRLPIPNGYNPAPSFYPPPQPARNYGQPNIGTCIPSPVKRKPARATLACNNCRIRKQKCDEATPCHFCGENSFDCLYQDVPPSKQDLNMVQLQNSVAGVCNRLNDLIRTVNAWERSVENRLTSSQVPQPPAIPAMGSIITRGLQGDHTTSDHFLWPDIVAISNTIPDLRRFLDNGHEIGDYPMQLEQDRGLLRVWGVGEGHDSHDDAQGLGSLNLDSHSSPRTMSSDTPRPFSCDGGLGPDRKPDFRYKTLWMLHDSYHTHMYCLHPFLNPRELRKMVQDFSAVYRPNTVQVANVISPTGLSEFLNPGVKRKRSSSLDGTIERSLPNAIVLLVLALGKVCLHKDALPSPQTDQNLTMNGVWGYTQSSPYYANSSFSTEHADSRPRNIDILPGMAYFSYATDIFGNQLGGNTLAHAQAMLLAALYLLQFARVLESWSWVNNACRVCLLLIKADMGKIRRPPTDGKQIEPLSTSPKEQHRLHLVKCVYWSCLQLESEILAVITTLTPSGVSKYMDQIGYPSDVDPEHEQSMWIYSSLSHLCVILNGTQNILYHGRSPNGSKGNSAKVFKQAHSMAKSLANWRQLLPGRLAWDDKIRHRPMSTLRG